MDEIQEEFNGSTRKQTKVETIAEGFKHVHNAAAAQSLIGKKFVISRSGQPLHVTTLPTDVLKTMPLPQPYEDELNPGGSNAATPASSGAFSGFGNAATPAVGAGDAESRRVSMAAKCMFLGLGAALEVIYPDENGDLLILEVVDIKKKPEAVMSMVEAVFDGGEHPEGHDKFNISFGLLKEIK
jgi:hypothetical protein